MADEKNEELKATSVQFPQRIVDALDKMAEKERRSRNNMILIIVEEYIKAHK